MKHVAILIKPASSLCNIKCNYCFYHDISSLREVRLYGKMTPELTETMIDQIYVDLVDGDHLSLTFQGGEPTMAGIRYFEHLVAYVSSQSKAVKVDYAIQTNGMVINQRWCRLFKDHHFLVGLSIDGPAIFHDQGRVDWRQKGTHMRVMKTKELFDQFEINYNVLTVLTNQIADHPDELFNFIMEQKLAYIQFIPCLDDLSLSSSHEFALTPQRFASFYQRLLTLWLAELDRLNYISIKLFDDLFHLLVNRQVTACGIDGHCQIQYVIEGDGSVYPCDFYVLDEYRLGYIQEQTLSELFSQPISFDFVCKRQELPSKCQSCSYRSLCGGGCKRMRDTMYVDNSQDYCGYENLLADFTEKLPQLIERLQRVPSC